MMFDVLKLGPEAAVQVAYKGGGDAAMAVLSREVDFNCGNLTSLIGNLKGGRMRALFTTTPQRWQDIPDVPTVRELGYPAARGDHRLERALRPARNDRPSRSPSGARRWPRLPRTRSGSRGPSASAACPA